MSGLKRSEAPSKEMIVKNKRRRRSLTTEDEINLLNRLKSGEHPMELSREFEISESTIRSLNTSETQLIKYDPECTVESYVPRDDTQEKMEQLLLTWYEEQRQEGNEHTMASICARATEIYNNLKVTKENSATKKLPTDEFQLENSEFKASKSWFINFRKRHKLENVTIFENEPPDPKAANVYITTFVKLLQTGGYQPHQVFSAFEVSFAWKRLPSCAFIAEEDKFRDRFGYDQISLLLCSNAEGDFYVKPMLIHRTRMPHCLRFRKIKELPVFWRCRGRETKNLPKVTPSHFHDWLIQCFTPSVRNYLKVMERPEYCLLLLSSHLKQMVLPTYDESFLNIEVLPEKTTRLLHPLTQSALSIFHTKYLHRFITQLAHYSEENNEGELYKVWQKYSIADAIHNIHKSLEDITAETWKSGWHRLWPEIANEPCHNTLLTDEIKQIIVKCRMLPGEGFESIDFEDIKQHLTGNVSSSSDDQPNPNESPQQLHEPFLKISSNVISNITVETKEKEDLLSFCSGMDFESAENTNINSDSEVSIIHFSDDEVLPETQQSEEVAVIEFHHTDDVNVEFRDAKVELHNKKSFKAKTIETRRQINLINKAFDLSHELIATLGQLEMGTNLNNFSNCIKDLMQPYAELKKKLLQPSIKDYFTSELRFP